MSYNFQIFGHGWLEEMQKLKLINTTRKLQNFTVIVNISFNFAAISYKGISGKQLDFGFFATP